MTPIKITPTLDHPLVLHTPEYVEVKEDDKRYFVLINLAEKLESRKWVVANKNEPSLEDAVRISAKTTEVLLSYGMDLDKDLSEQLKWLDANPYPEPPAGVAVSRLPTGMDPTDIFRNMLASKRDTVVKYAPKKYNIEEVCYKLGLDESGVPKKAPYLDVIVGLDKKTYVKLANGEVTEEEVESVLAGKKRQDRTNSEIKNNNELIPPRDIYTSAVGAKLSALLNEYDKQIVQDAAQLRTYITNKLIEISSCGNAKDELRALELLGKISDVGLFVEKSEVNIVSTTPAALEHSIKEKINRILGQRNIDIEDAQYTEMSLNPEPVHLEHQETEELLEYGDLEEEDAVEVGEYDEDFEDQNGD